MTLSPNQFRKYSVVDPEGGMVEQYHGTLEHALMHAENAPVAPGDRFTGPRGETLMSYSRKGWEGGPIPRKTLEANARDKQAQRARRQARR
jgi:hypothetical protein